MAQNMWPGQLHCLAYNRFWLVKLLFWLQPLRNGDSRGAVNTIYHSARVCDTKEKRAGPFGCRRLI